ncbi:MAG: hypothetical protein KIS66_05750 [Fimbriimonadaceae bacterium]|nr:hypothetical protein [Fimbriimonadaceae bacterium]
MTSVVPRANPIPDERSDLEKTVDEYRVRLREAAKERHGSSRLYQEELDCLVLKIGSLGRFSSREFARLLGSKSYTYTRKCRPNSLHPYIRQESHPGMRYAYATTPDGLELLEALEDELFSRTP